MPALESSDMFLEQMMQYKLRFKEAVENVSLVESNIEIWLTELWNDLRKDTKRDDLFNKLEAAKTYIFSESYGSAKSVLSQYSEAIKETNDYSLRVIYSALDFSVFAMETLKAYREIRTAELEDKDAVSKRLQQVSQLERKAIDNDDLYGRLQKYPELHNPKNNSIYVQIRMLNNITRNYQFHLAMREALEHDDLETFMEFGIIFDYHLPETFKNTLKK